MEGRESVEGIELGRREIKGYSFFSLIHFFFYSFPKFTLPLFPFLSMSCSIHVSLHPLAFLPFLFLFFLPSYFFSLAYTHFPFHPIGYPPSSPPHAIFHLFLTPSLHPLSLSSPFIFFILFSLSSIHFHSTHLIVYHPFIFFPMSSFTYFTVHPFPFILYSISHPIASPFFHSSPCLLSSISYSIPLPPFLCHFIDPISYSIPSLSFHSCPYFIFHPFSIFSPISYLPLLSSSSIFYSYLLFLSSILFPTPSLHPPSFLSFHLPTISYSTHPFTHPPSLPLPLSRPSFTLLPFLSLISPSIHFPLHPSLHSPSLPLPPFQT